jgi:hypothetical protein
MLLLPLAAGEEGKRLFSFRPNDTSEVPTGWKVERTGLGVCTEADARTRFDNLMVNSK